MQDEHLKRKRQILTRDTFFDEKVFKGTSWPNPHPEDDHDTMH